MSDSTNTAPQTITRVTALTPYLVEYVDGKGAKMTRLVMRDPHTGGCVMIGQSAGGANIATMTHKWFNKAMAEMVGSEAEVEAESV
jgi:acyl-CoA reductase-like NAD-dependent aldehyde dehydrogenase